MAEIGITYQLITSLGVLDFNDYSSDSYLHLTEVKGLDSPNIRGDQKDRPQRDGIILADSFLGGRFPTLEGRIMWNTYEARTEKEALIRAHARAMLRADATLLWSPTGLSDRIATVRLNERVEISNDGVEKSFMIPLVAADPNVYSATSYTNDTSAVTAGGGGGLIFPFVFPLTFTYDSGGGSGVFVNSGDVDTYPTIKMWGPVVNPTIMNLTTGKFTSFTGLSIDDGSYVEIDMLNETVRLNGDVSTSLIGKLASTYSEFWPLIPGSNTVRMVGSDPDAATCKATITWRDAYA